MRNVPLVLTASFVALASGVVALIVVILRAIDILG